MRETPRIDWESSARPRSSSSKRRSTIWRDQLHQVEARSSSYRFGYRPADNNWLALLTSQFLHAGVFHLLGNMWFLWLVGCNVEDGWGRIVFPAFYLSAGAIAALAHKLGDPTSVVPLVGASGAIAGAMGAFLIRHATSKIKFFALLLWKPMRFAAPAYLMLPLWFLVQVVSGVYQSQGPGVAYLAHVGGFVYGVLVAMLFRVSGFEKSLDATIENRGAFTEDPMVAEAARNTDQGRYGAAITKLEGLLEKQPRHVDALLELLRASAAAGDTGRECRAKIKLIEIYLQMGAPETAMSLYGELGAADQRHSVPPSLRMRLGRQYERLGSASEAWTTFQELHDQTDDLIHRARRAHCARRARHEARPQERRATPLATRSRAREHRGGEHRRRRNGPAALD